jgi:hypothetical protein
MSRAPEEGRVYRSLDEFDRRFFPKPVKGFEKFTEDDVRRAGARLTRKVAHRVLGNHVVHGHSLKPKK